MSLDTEWSELTALHHLLKHRLGEINQRREQLRKDRGELGLTHRPVRDHALLRYLERHKGIDVEAIRRELADLADEAVPARDGEHHWHPSGVLLIIAENGAVVTVLSPEQTVKWNGRKLKNGSRVDLVTVQNDDISDTRAEPETVK